MSEFEVEFPEDFLSEFLNADFDEIAEEALKEAVPVLEKSMKERCAEVVRHEGDSELVSSIKAGKPTRTKTDAWIANVKPTGYSKTKVYHREGKKKQRTYPVSNALKAIWKEYGIPGKQAPQPFLQAATNAAENAVVEKMQEVYNRMVDG